MTETYGALLKRWRAARKRSQLDLAGDAGVSTRHLSFIESGRSNPSREMVLSLARALDVPLREQNELLHAAGFAPVFPQRALGSDELAPVLASLEAVLERMNPFPCVVLDRRWVILRSNQAALRLLGAIVEPALLEALGAELNLMRLFFHPSMRATLVNFDEIAPTFVYHLQRDADAGLEDSKQLLAELGLPRPLSQPSPLGAAVVPLKLKRGELTLSLFTTITTLGTPLDVTLQELRIETYLPADALTAQRLRSLTE